MKAKWIACLVVLLVSRAAVYGVTPSFQGLGRFDGFRDSYAFSVSADGSSIVGHCFKTTGVTTEAFLWTAASGMQRLFPEETRSLANAVSDDGGTVVGTVGQDVFRWQEGSGASILPLPSGWYRPLPRRVSADGSVIIGWDDSPDRYEAWRWTDADGMQGLGFLPGYERMSRALSMTPDGAIVYGSSYNGGMQPFRWTSGSGLMPYPVAPADVSGDGLTLLTGHSYQAALWTEDGGYRFLGMLPGSTGNAAQGMSADATVVAGISHGHDTGQPYNEKAFIWTEPTGMCSLKDYLIQECGLDVQEWDLVYANDVSADGSSVVGYGVDPSGKWQAYRAVIPEPATLSLMVLGGLALIRRRRT